MRNLHGLARFYKHFIKNYIILAILLNKIVNKNKGHAKWVELFKEVVRLHGLPKTIILDMDSKEPCGVSLALSYSYQLLDILKWMDKLRFNLLSPLDLLPFPNISSMLNCDELSKAQFVKDLHAKACSHIEKNVEQYANIVYKGKTQRVLKKLLSRRDGPFKVLTKISGSAYILDMPQTYEGNHNFHVTDLSPCDISTQEPNLRTNSFQERKLDEILTTTSIKERGQGDHGDQNTSRAHDK
ncbi:hypothetical protein CR513_61791, partial [Mucuna pruriens]